MITLKEWMEATGFRITEGGDYGWDCYGPNSYRLDSWNGEQDGHSASIVFDTRTHEVYEVSTCDYTRNRAYRLINPAYVEANKAEARDKEVAFDEAWEGTNYATLEVDSDMIDKITAIFNEEDYDTRIQVPLDLEDDLLFDLMIMAHKRDITLNQMVEQVLTAAIDKQQ